MLAVGISVDGRREILGLEMALSETEEGWRRFVRHLKERGLSGVELATSDAHEGLRQALEEACPGLIWQRCQSHFRRNAEGRTPSGYRDQMHEVLDQILEASSQKEARTRLDDLREQLEEKAPSAWTPLRKASTRRPPCSLCPRSIASDFGQPTCWSASFRRSGGEKR
jgi:transposase-like protein